MRNTVLLFPIRFVNFNATKRKVPSRQRLTELLREYLYTFARLYTNTNNTYQKYSDIYNNKKVHQQMKL